MENLNLSKFLAPTIFFAVCCFLLILMMILRKKVIQKQGLTEELARALRTPLQIFMGLTVLYVFFETLNYKALFHPMIEHAYSILATCCFGWLAIKIINLLSSLLLHHFDITQENNYRARKVHTQVRVFKRLAVAFVVLFIIGASLSTFSTVRAQGMSLLASAGVLSILVGLAAQKTMSTFFAGVQIAISQPIRVDDVVVVENEWGRIEKIHLTFVVVKLWDLRRLIVPITYFTDRAFQNWTQKTADILGTVMLYVDYTMPIKAIREEVDRLLEGNKLWDKKVKAVQVTNATEHTQEVRILTSSPNSGASFDLRCAIREQLISFIQKNYPSCLPKVRAEILKDTQAPNFPQTPQVPQDPVRSPAPTLDSHPKPMSASLHGKGHATPLPKKKP